MRYLSLLVFCLLVFASACWGAGEPETEAPSPLANPDWNDPEEGIPPDPEAGHESSDHESSVPADYPYAEQRDALVDRFIVGAGITDPSVIDAMRSVPRHEFVLSEYRNLAYRDTALPINAGQTISQPYVVAFMTEALDLQAQDTVLEVGTGSGYQAAVLAEIVESVVSIEIIDELAESARARLERLGYDNIAVIAGDGYYGLPSRSPFDAVIVTAAAGHIPPPLVEQLVPGGRLVIPVGPVYSVQTLILVEKSADGSITTRQLLPVRFVPMTGAVQGR